MSDPGKADPELQHFLESEGQRQRFQQLVHGLTEMCWDKCTEGVKPGAKLDGRTETCLSYCVERFIDTSNHIVSKLSASSMASGASSEYLQ